MVDRKTLDERGVFVGDMGELQDRLEEAHCTLGLLVLPMEEHNAELARVIESVARMVRHLSYDLGDIEEVLTKSGALVEGEEYMARKRAAEAAQPAKVVAIAGKVARCSRKAVR